MSEALAIPEDDVSIQADALVTARTEDIELEVRTIEANTACVVKHANPVRQALIVGTMAMVALAH